MARTKSPAEPSTSNTTPKGKAVTASSTARANGTHTTEMTTTTTPNEKARSPSPDPADRPLGPLAVTIPASEREEVKVNNANLTELKNACDDAVKRFLARPELFKQIYLHTDVRLALGWLSVFVAAGTGFYGYKVDFEQSKPVVTIGLVVYIILTALSTAYTYFVEGDTIFVGKRKTFSKRIITERITIASSTPPPKKSIALSSSSTSKDTDSSSSNSSEDPCPLYSLSLSYVRSTNGGKTLLSRGRTKASVPYNRFFDERGVLDQEKLERWVGGVVEGVMDGKSS